MRGCTSLATESCIDCRNNLEHAIFLINAKFYDTYLYSSPRQVCIKARSSRILKITESAKKSSTRAVIHVLKPSLDRWAGMEKSHTIEVSPTGHPAIKSPSRFQEELVTQGLAPGLRDAASLNLYLNQGTNSNRMPP